MANFNINRPLTSYTKVQHFIGKLVRNKKYQLNKKLNTKKFLDVGCGYNTHINFVNLDYCWFPNADICWDITKGLPFPNKRFEGIFTEHCIEHISFDNCKKVLKEFYRILKPNGVLRIIVPDGELYLDIYQQRKQGLKIEMPYEKGFITPMHRINGIFRDHGHLFIYDFETLKIMLNNIGFNKIFKVNYMQGSKPELLIDTESRSIESLYLEAIK